MFEYRYRPQDNRTPVHHHLYGALEWDKLIRWPEEIHDPDFQPVKQEVEDAGPATEKAPAATEPRSKKDADAATADGSK